MLCEQNNNVIPVEHNYKILMKFFVQSVHGPSPDQCECIKLTNWNRQMGIRGAVNCTSFLHLLVVGGNRRNMGMC